LRNIFTQVTEKTRQEIAQVTEEKGNTEKILKDLQISFLKSREEVAQLASENQKLINVVARFSDVMEESDLSR
jgi:hypothetical protein